MRSITVDAPRHQSVVAHRLANECLGLLPDVYPGEGTVVEALVKDLDVDAASSDTFVVFLQILAPLYNRLYLLLAWRLARLGVPSCFLFRSSMAFSSTDLVYQGRRLSNSIELRVNKRLLDSGAPHVLSRQWTVDPGNRFIGADGVNLYPVIVATIQTARTEYDVPFDDPEVAAMLDDLILSCDLLMDYFQMFKAYAREHGKRIKLVAWESGYVPNGVFFILCRELSENRDVEFVDLYLGYTRYMSSHFHSVDLLASNRTLKRMPTRYSRQREEFLASLACTDQGGLEAFAKGFLKPSAEWEPSPEQRKALDWITNHAGQGRRVFLLLGHLFFDTSLNEDKGSFTGMSEWVRKTVEFFKGRDDILVLKPHPMETVRLPRQTLESFVRPMGLTENMLLLPPDLLTLRDLQPHISCGLIWRSTGGIELVIGGVSCNICGFTEYHFLDLPFARTEAEYFAAMEDLDSLAVTEAIRREAMYCLYDLKESHVSAHWFDYDASQRLHTIKADAVELMEGPDAPNMERLMRAILD